MAVLHGIGLDHGKGSVAHILNFQCLKFAAKIRDCNICAGMDSASGPLLTQATHDVSLRQLLYFTVLDADSGILIILIPVEDISHT